MKFRTRNGLTGNGTSDRPTIAALRKTFEALVQDQSDLPEETEHYTTTDERIYVASALYVLDNRAEEKSKYLQAVLQWLKPPDPALQPEELEAYWEHRWCAVSAVEHMNGAKEVIPLLSAMLSEQSKKSWVSVHAPRAIKALRGANDQ